MAPLQTVTICMTVSGGNGSIYFSAGDPLGNVSYFPQLIAVKDCVTYSNRTGTFGTHYLYLDNRQDSSAKTVVVSIQ